ncbi:hypothetical protein Tco_1090662 [Tanacetum coccineum]|uniref:Uncharacterized protein n=1 Tax=Tanacetum coccineum TaxID=301880 RepID=A0ABQ5I620_9ASTR
METSRLASLHEPNLCGTQLVAAVVAPTSLSGNTSVKSRTTVMILIQGSSILAFIRALAAPKSIPTITSKLPRLNGINELQGLRTIE